MKVQKYFMRTRMHGTPTGRLDCVCHGRSSNAFGHACLSILVMHSTMSVCLIVVMRSTTSVCVSILVMHSITSVCLLVTYPAASVCLRVCSKAFGHVYVSSSNAFGPCLSVCIGVSVVSNIFQ